MSGVNTPQVIAVIAANTILGKLEPSFGAWVDKDEEIAGIVLSCMTRASNDLAQRVQSLEKALQSAEAQLAAALKDKARLDWLGDNWGHKIGSVGKYYTQQEFDNSRAGKGVTASFRDAIDAVIAAAQPRATPGKLEGEAS
jgi:hypothetical protein